MRKGARKGKVNEKYDDKYTKANRTFPTAKAICLFLILFIQIGVIFWAVSYKPQPQDRIKSYTVVADPKADGSLDIRYEFLWEALDPSEDLTWIKIGMANENYSVYPDSLSDSIVNYRQKSEDGQVHLELDLDRAYKGGETVCFSFKINQKDMLCRDEKGYFYEFVPGWFNATPVERYTFYMGNGLRKDKFEGSLECGQYVQMNVRYPQSVRFEGCTVTPYRAFDDSNAYNELEVEKRAMVVLVIVGVVALLAVQVWIVDSVVSYHRGRGFLYGHGYHVHTYGRSNPYYIRARDRYNATHGSHGGRSGGGCACACACAGGGRAGCSQKDTYGHPAPEKENAEKQK